MTEDQSVFCRRQIYYDQRGAEALIYGSDKKVINKEEGKKEFTISEDEILRYNLIVKCSLFFIVYLL